MLDQEQGVSASASLLRESEPDFDRADRKNPALLLLATVVLMIAVAAVLIVTVPMASKATSKTSSDAITADSDTFNFTLVRQNYSPLEYFDHSIENPIGNYAFLAYAKHSAIIEPQASMQLYIYGEPEGDFEFTVCPVPGEGEVTDIPCQVGNISTSSSSVTTVSFSCTPFDLFSVTLTQIMEDGSLIERAKSTALCLYVRREVRELTTYDRDRFLNASHMLSNVSEEEGQELYGYDYHSSSYLAKFHFFNAAWQDADHYHEGTSSTAPHTYTHTILTHTHTPS
jgi:hypothetical protein